MSGNKPDSTGLLPPDSNPNSGRLLSNLFHQGAANVAASIANILLVPLVIKTAGASVYGGFVVLNAMFLLFTQAFTFGAGYKCRRMLPAASDPIGRDRLFIPNASFQLITYLAAGLVLMLGMPVVRHVFFHGESPLNLWLALPLVFTIFLINLSDDYFRYTHRVKFISGATVARSFGFAALVLLIANLSHGLTVDKMFLAQIVAGLLPALILWWFVSREVVIRFRLGSWQDYRGDIRYGLPLATAVLVENFLATSDRYILAGRLSTKAVGAYSAAFAVGSLILLVPKVISSVLPASLSNAVDSGRKPEAEALLNHALQGYFVLALPFIGGAFILSPPLLAVVADAEVADIARWVPPIIAVGTTIYGYTWIVFSLLFVQMDTRVWFRANASAAFTAVALNLLLLSIFHRVEAAAVAMAVSYAVSAFVIERSRDRSWHVHIGGRLLGKVVLATLIMTTTLWQLGRVLGANASPLRVVSLEVPAGVLVYAVALFALRPLPMSDLRAVLRRWRASS